MTGQFLLQRYTMPTLCPIYGVMWTAVIAVQTAKSTPIPSMHIIQSIHSGTPTELRTLCTPLPNLSVRKSLSTVCSTCTSSAGVCRYGNWPAMKPIV